MAQTVAATSPAGVRQLIRSGNGKVTTTSGLCAGHLQANIVIMPSAHAADFDRFVAANSQACPLLYRSQPGEVGAPPLAAASDIRTDVPLYRVFVDGELRGEVEDLRGHWTDDLVCYYFGCSFTFESALQAAGVPIRNVEQGRNVTMFKTSVPCVAAGAFACDLVVSMRPLPRDKIDLAVAATAPLVRAHGGPVHVGDPAAIGVADVMAPDYGDPVQFADGDVPVFWACGVTSALAAVSARPPLVVTHSPGAMFVCDVPDTDALVTCRGKDHRVRRLEEIALRDPMRRGAAHLFCPGDLRRAARALAHCRCVAVATGFPCNADFVPPHETDGPPGAVALCRTLGALGKRVLVLCDKGVFEIMRRCTRHCDARLLLWPPEDGPPGDPQQLLAAEGIEHLVAVERASQAADGRYYTMGARDISALCGPIDDVFEAATARGVPTTAVGDGGNELGMRKVHEQVRRYIPHGPTIASAVAVQHLIAAGVSNWGAYALAAAVCLEMDMPTLALEALQVEAQRAVLSDLMALGVRDGCSRELALSVDGMQFDDEHTAILRSIQDVLQV